MIVIKILFCFSTQERSAFPTLLMTRLANDSVLTIDMYVINKQHRNDRIPKPHTSPTYTPIIAGIVIWEYLAFAFPIHHTENTFNACPIASISTTLPQGVPRSRNRTSTPDLRNRQKNLMGTPFHLSGAFSGVGWLLDSWLWRYNAEPERLVFPGFIARMETLIYWIEQRAVNCLLMMFIFSSTADS